MKTIRVIWLALLATFLLGACGEKGPVIDYFQPSNKELAKGKQSYEDGDYQTALIHLRKAQEMGLDDKRDQVIAHKYVAFIHCVSGRESECRREFRNALEVDPGFALSTAEGGHPVWGPIFRSEKSRVAQ
ncbi:MAG: TssQ family T6SS-associated lipoprotein [Gallionella sp.]|nr:TssQ family T6SS-associated lipoprotein [Gallionella sp.]